MGLTVSNTKSFLFLTLNHFNPLFNYSTWAFIPSIMSIVELDILFLRLHPLSCPLDRARSHSLHKKKVGQMDIV